MPGAADLALALALAPASHPRGRRQHVPVCRSARRCVNFTSGLLTAALAGGFSAVALPVPAFVIGARAGQDRAARTLDQALLERIGGWLLAAVAFGACGRCSPEPLRAAQAGDTSAIQCVASPIV